MSTTQDARKKFTMGAAQENLYAVNLANVIANVDTDKMGTVYNPFTSRPIAINGTAAATTSYTAKAYSNDADSLQVNRRAAAAEHIDSYDWKSAEISLLQDRGMNMGKTISQVIDGYVLSLPVTTSGVVTLGDAGVAGASTPWTSSTTVIDDIINTSFQEIDLANSGAKRFMVVSSYEANDLRGHLQSTGNMVADEVIRNGIPSQISKIGTSYSGVDIFQSNNITQEVVLTMDTNPTAGDTMNIAGVVVTFVATLSGSASEIHIASTVDITRANLEEWLDAFGANSEAEATDTGYSAASTADQSTLSRLQVSSVNSNGADTLTITTRGVVKFSETFTAGTNVFGTAYRFLVFGDYGSINLYLPSAGMDYVEKEVGGKPGVEVYMEQFYNAVIWTRNKDRVIAIKVN